MTRDEKITILTALETAINDCMSTVADSDAYDEKQYFWGKADGLERASMLIAGRPETRM